MALRVGFTELNTSVQLEDFLYFIPSTSITNDIEFNHTNAIPTFIGKIIAIETLPPSDLIWITAQELNSTGVDITITSAGVPDGSMFMFRKDNRVNVTDLVGYYAEVKLSNNSTDKAELFSIGSNATINSK